MKFACYADTPLHVLNCVNFVWHNTEETRGNCDLYIHKQFAGYEHMIDALRRSGLFSSVTECSLPIKRDEGRFEHAVVRTAELFTARRQVRKWTGRTDVSDDYDVLLMPAPLRFTVALFDFNRQAKIWFYEDGAANYFGDILDAYGPKSKDLLKKLFNKGHGTVIPERMYVNNCSMCASTTKCRILPLPAIELEDRDFIACLEEVFASEKPFAMRKIVFLSQPMEDMRCKGGADPNGILDELLENIGQYAGDVVIRPHPRDGRSDFCGLHTDRGSTLWELLCATAVNEDTVLIGTISTAQLTPKLLFGREPYLLFTYPLFNADIPDSRRADMDHMVELLRNSYSKPEKVVSIATMGEYREALRRIME